MRMIRFIAGNRPAGPTAVTVGSFDGVHHGHRAIMERLKKAGASENLETVVLSFDPHPAAVLRGHHPPMLASIEERARRCVAAGVDAFAVIEFDRDVSELDPTAYVERILLDELDMKVIVVGHDHRFGRDAGGDENLLRSMGADRGFRVEAVDPVMMDGEPVSSSRIRRLLLEGHVEKAAECLGRRYAVRGTVVHGDARGRKIGFPTANIEPIHEQRLIPANGVYAVYVTGEVLASEPLHGEHQEHPSRYGGMMNVGVRPTFEGNGRHAEVYLFDFDGDLYGHELRVEFARRIRDEVKFDSVEALVAQLKDDEVRCRAALQTD